MEQTQLLVPSAQVIGFRRKTKNINETVKPNIRKPKESKESQEPKYNCLVCGKPVIKITRKGFCSSCYMYKVYRLYYILETLTRVLKKYGVSQDNIDKEIMEEKKRFFPNLPQEVLEAI